MAIEFQGIIYNDDRMFVLYLCKCTIEENDQYFITKIHHNEAPENFIWTVITFRNNERYTAVKGDHFDTKEEAENFIRKVEPEVPLVSLKGGSPSRPLPYDKFLEWKTINGLNEYDYKKMFLPDTVNPIETLYHPK